MLSTTIMATLVVDLEGIIREPIIVRVAVGPCSDVTVLTLETTPDMRMNVPGRGGFLKLWADRLNHYRIDHLLGGRWHSLTLSPTRENYHFVQPFGGDEWLLVRGRAESDSDPNASVYDSNGALSCSFHAGDGIQDVQTTDDGQIWVSYFDEGVFGDKTLGRAGLTCLDRSGHVRFRFNDLATADGVPDIADCYALNVCSEQNIWLCYYMDFPLVRLEEDRIAGLWSGLGVDGTSAFAVSGHHVLFAGGYDQRNLLLLADLDSGTVRKFAPVNTDGKSIQSFTAFGRGNRLWLLVGHTLYVVDLSALTG